MRDGGSPFPAQLQLNAAGAPCGWDGLSSTMLAYGLMQQLHTALLPPLSCQGVGGGQEGFAKGTFGNREIHHTCSRELGRADTPVTPFGQQSTTKASPQWCPYTLEDFFLCTSADMGSSKQLNRPARTACPAQALCLPRDTWSNTESIPRNSSKQNQKNTQNY